MEEQEKALFFYEWVYDHVEYDTELRNKTVYDAVMEGSSVCWGLRLCLSDLVQDVRLKLRTGLQRRSCVNRVWIEGGGTIAILHGTKARGAPAGS